MALARLNKAGGGLPILHRECHRVVLATKDSTKAGFEHVLTVINSMLQNTKHLFEPDAAAIAAIQAFRPAANISAIRDRGQLLRAEVRRQLSLYHKEMLAASRKRRNTMAVAANLDSAGLDVKQAQGRLPADLTLITAMIAKLWDQVFERVWTKVIVPWLRAQKMESSVQSYLLCESFEGFAHYAEAQGLTPQDLRNLRTLLQLELSFLRSQVWVGSLVVEYTLSEYGGRKLYEFRTSRSFKTAGKQKAESLPASKKWPLSEKTSALVHTLVQLTASATDHMFPGRSLRAVSEAASKDFAQLGFNWCGIPRLGLHSMRTYHCCRDVNNPDVGVQDYPAFAARMQVFMDTMVSVYAAYSMKGPAAQRSNYILVPRTRTRYVLKGALRKRNSKSLSNKRNCRRNSSNKSRSRRDRS
jgi:hypothetical protein